LQLLFIVASVIFPQHVVSSAQVWAAVPLDPLLAPLVPLLLPAVAQAGRVHVDEQVVNPAVWKQEVHAESGVHFEMHAVSPHAQALLQVMYVPHAPVKLPDFQPAPKHCVYALSHFERTQSS
jgi:hypothetical protein